MVWRMAVPEVRSSAMNYRMIIHEWNDELLAIGGLLNILFLCVSVHEWEDWRCQRDRARRWIHTHGTGMYERCFNSQLQGSLNMYMFTWTCIFLSLACFNNIGLLTKHFYFIREMFLWKKNCFEKAVSSSKMLLDKKRLYSKIIYFKFKASDNIGLKDIEFYYIKQLYKIIRGVMCWEKKICHQNRKVERYIFLWLKTLRLSSSLEPPIWTISWQVISKTKKRRDVKHVSDLILHANILISLWSRRAVRLPAKKAFKLSDGYQALL